ncbi:MAG TPA: PKD domain-containing protein [Solirubrobacteraceae bacterium]|nr:PKD domain-containing protein [Solirubrobacteraceae bacterium]HUB74691.1 PKD domain-containing protein [Solirubrobacteraceae bacterium]
MSIFARPSRSPIATHRAPARRALLAVGATLAAGLSGLLAQGVPVAQALVTEVAETQAGVSPRNATTLHDGLAQLSSTGVFSETLEPETFANAEGNPVLHEENVHLVYWVPDNDYYHPEWKNLINTFMEQVSAESYSTTNVFAVDTQYTDKSDEPASYDVNFAGAYNDTAPYPTSGCTDPDPLTEAKAHNVKALACLTDTQIRAQLQSFISTHGASRGMNDVYYVLTPPGVTVCLDSGHASGHCSDYSVTEEEATSYAHSFCSYHSDINPGDLASGDGETVIYGVVPWTAGGAGDGQLAAVDRTQAYDCQDGGFDPVSKPIEQYEEAEGAREEEPNQPTCPDEDGFCDGGLADLIINQIAVEQQDIVTDPLLNAWQDEDHNEVADECRNFFAPAEGAVSEGEGSEAGTLANQRIDGGAYYLNDAFNAAGMRLNAPGVQCLNRILLEPKFSPPQRTKSGEPVAFDGMQSDVSLNASADFPGGGGAQNDYATYTWNFGDGSAPVSGFAPGSSPCEAPWNTPCAASVLHTYEYGGTYEVTLTIKDVGGNEASVSHDVIVSGPSAPSGGSGSGSGSGEGGASSSGAGASASQSPAATPSAAAGSAAAVPAPVVTAAIVRQALGRVTRKGLAVRYSVNEQVAGHFDVLLSSAVAKRLRIKGAPASGLPAGSAPQLVIAKAILVTTRGGRSAVRIHFSKATAARLRRARKVSLMLRLVVRNAATSNPATDTVISSVTLSR